MGGSAAMTQGQRSGREGRRDLRELYEGGPEEDE